MSKIAEDMCQIDDFIVGIVAALLSRQGAHVDIYSTDGRFFGKTIVLPVIRYPFYMVVHTHEGRVGIPVYQRDSAILEQELRNTANPSYIVPYDDPEQPMWRQHVDTKTKMERKHVEWSSSAASSPAPQVGKQEVGKPS